MISKKPRIDFSEFDNVNYIQRTYKKMFECKSTEIQELVRTSLNAKKLEIREAKLAFSAVARENSELKEENEWHRSQREGCFKLIEDNDEQHKELVENLVNQNKLCIRELNDEKKSLILENDQILEKLRIKTNELDLTKVYIEAKDLEITKEKSKSENLKNSFFLANFVMENMLLEETEKNFSLEFSLEEKDNLIEQTERVHKDILEEVKNKEGVIKQNKLVISNLENTIETQSQEKMIIETENQLKEHMLTVKDNDHVALLSQVSDLEVEKNEKKDNQLSEKIEVFKNLTQTPEMDVVHIENQRLTQELEKIENEKNQKEEALVERKNEHKDLLTQFEKLADKLKEKLLNVKSLEKKVEGQKLVIDNISKEKNFFDEERQEQKQYFENQLLVKCKENESEKEDNGLLLIQLNENQNLLKLYIRKLKYSEDKLTEKNKGNTNLETQNQLNNLQDKLKENECQIEEKKVVIQNLEMNVVKIENHFLTQMQEIEKINAEINQKEEVLLKRENEHKKLITKFKELDDIVKENIVIVIHLEKKVNSQQLVICNLIQERDCIDKKRQKEKLSFESQVLVRCQEKEIEKGETASLLVELDEKLNLLELQKIIIDAAEETKLKEQKEMLGNAEAKYKSIVEKYKALLKKETIKVRNLEQMSRLKTIKLNKLKTDVIKFETLNNQLESSKVCEEEFKKLKKLADLLENEKKCYKDAELATVKQLHQEILELESNRNDLNKKLSVMKDNMAGNIQIHKTELDAMIAEKKSMLGSLMACQKKLQKKVISFEEVMKALQNTISDKETIIDNLGKAFEEQPSSAEVQNEQNRIYQMEHINILAELNKCSLENLNFQKYIGDGGAWVKEKEEEINSIKATLKDKEEEVVEFSNKLQEKETKFFQIEKEIQEQKSCKMCMDEDVSTVFLPCGHLCCCTNCANLNVKSCPICRGDIKDKLRVFQS